MTAAVVRYVELISRVLPEQQYVCGVRSVAHPEGSHRIVQRFREANFGIFSERNISEPEVIRLRKARNLSVEGGGLIKFESTTAHERDDAAVTDAIPST